MKYSRDGFRKQGPVGRLLGARRMDSLQTVAQGFVSFRCLLLPTVRGKRSRSSPAERDTAT